MSLASLKWALSEWETLSHKLDNTWGMTPEFGLWPSHIWVPLHPHSKELWKTGFSYHIPSDQIEDSRLKRVLYSWCSIWCSVNSSSRLWSDGVRMCWPSSGRPGLESWRFVFTLGDCGHIAFLLLGIFPFWKVEVIIGYIHRIKWDLAFKKHYKTCYYLALYKFGDRTLVLNSPSAPCTLNI